MTLVPIETKLHGSTFGYANLMQSLQQYISFYFNINIATFVGFQIAQKRERDDDYMGTAVHTKIRSKTKNDLIGY